MAIINRPPANVPRKAITVRMPLPIADALHDYASFIGSSLDHVVVEALKLIFRKDSEFKAWQNAQPAALSQPSSEGDSAESTPPSSKLLFDEAKRNGRRDGSGEKS
ncbi:MAG TPA: hypothetical protein VMT20_07615 [Terriglobia bacterium]|nr:hypothetical protein [Terriglobia bacterium]